VSPTNEQEPGGWEILRDVVVGLGRWVKEHEEDLRVFGLWGSVNLACDETHLYAPPDRPGWERISEARHADTDRAGMEALILSLYGVGCANPIGLMRPCRTREPVRRVDPVSARDRAAEEQRRRDLVWALAARVRDRDAGVVRCST